MFELVIIPLVSLILGALSGYFLAHWIIITLSVLCIVVIIYIIIELNRKPSGNGTSGAMGATLIGLYIVICLVLFLASMWITYHLSGGNIFKALSIQIPDIDIDFLRKKP